MKKSDLNKARSSPYRLQHQAAPTEHQTGKCRPRPADSNCRTLQKPQRFLAMPGKCRDTQQWRRRQETSGISVVCACTLSHFSCIWLYATIWTAACQAPLSLGFSRQEYWVGSHSLLQEIFSTQGSNWVSNITCEFFTIWATEEAQNYMKCLSISCTFPRGLARIKWFSAGHKTVYQHIKACNSALFICTVWSP